MALGPRPVRPGQISGRFPYLLAIGFASAGLTALRAEHRGLEWHAVGGYFPILRGFWRLSARVFQAGTSNRTCAPPG
jgi:hypothetical protein